MFQPGPSRTPPLSALEFRAAAAGDIPAMRELIFTHGPNQWNFLPEAEVSRHIEAVASGETLAVLAFDRASLVGMASAGVGEYYPQYEDAEGRSRPRGYIAEAVVHRDFTGRGIGPRLLEEAKLMLRAAGVSTIYIKRHADNQPSGRMMHKAGFETVDEFYDPEIRTSGSRRTVVARFTFRRTEEGGASGAAFL